MLTLFAIRNAKAKDKPYKLSDGSGLHLLITPGGTKLWRFRYRSGGKQLMIGFGPFPEITISEAREKREEDRKLVAKGVDPSKQRKEERRAAALAAKNTFGPVAKDYLEKIRDEGRSKDTIDKVRWHLEDLAAPLEPRPINEITSAEIIDLLKRSKRAGVVIRITDCEAPLARCFASPLQLFGLRSTRLSHFEEHFLR